MKPLYLFLLLSICFSHLTHAQCPIAATCTPGAASNPLAAAFGMGILNVTLGSINNTTPGTIDGYQDYSCIQVAALSPGATYPVSITTNAAANENVRVWIDYDNNGVFDPVGELFFSSNNQILHNGVSQLIPPTAVLGVRLRMRVAADAQSSPVPTPCSTPQYSQTEDYSVLLGVITQKPIAAFAVGTAQACAGVFTFTDQSQRGPATWNWTFGDGTTSTQRNPTHTYAQPGTYPVQLRVCNAFGCDSILQATAASWYATSPVPAQCIPATASYCCSYGITQVSLGGQLQASADGAVGYEDFTCRRRFTGQQNQDLTLQITTGGAGRYDTRVYIDYNNDGLFNEGTELVFEALNTTSPTGTIRLAGGGPTNTPLRLRVLAAATGLPLTACSSLVYGQAEDYSLVITPPTSCPTLPGLVRPVGRLAVCQGQGTQLTVPNAPGGNVFQQWQSSPDSLVWANVLGAHGSSLTISLIPAATYYRLLAACGSTTRTTAAVRVTPDPNLCYCTNLYYNGHCGVPTVNRLTRAWIPQTTLDHTAQPCGTTGAAVHYQLATSPANHTATLQRNGTYQFNVTTNNSLDVGLWIDYNHNGRFDTSEFTAIVVSAANVGAALFTVPATAVLGVTGMRLRTMETDPTASQACLMMSFGEAYDYQVTIAPGSCEAPLSKGAVLGPRTFCAGTVPPLSVLGQTIGTTLQWQTSPDSLVWTNQPGAQGRLLSGPPLQDSLYVRVQSSCGPAVAYTPAVYLRPDPQLCFCRPTTASCGLEFLQRVQIGNTALQSRGSTCIMSTGTNRIPYHYYPPTTLGNTATLLRGISYPFVTYDGGSRPYVRVWLDYNHDGHYTDDEAANLRTGSVGPDEDSLATFTVPANAPLGTLRMRVVASATNIWLTSRILCSGVGGETRDYLVTIAAPTPAPGPPVAGTITGTPSICPGQRLRLTLAGQSYGTALQWEAQLLGSATWAPIAGATGPVLVTALFASATSYRVAATANGTTTYSAPHAVAAGPCPCKQNLSNASNCDAFIRAISIIGPGAYLAPVNDFCTSQLPRAYSDYGLQHDSVHTTLRRGSRYRLGVYVPGSIASYNPFGGVWFDYNRNGVFEQSEYVATVTGIQHLAISGGVFTVPATAPLGQVAMRVRTLNLNRSGFVLDSTMACTAFNSGETEDYIITIADECPFKAPHILFDGARAGAPPAAGRNLVLAAQYGFPAGTTWRWTGPNGFTSTAAQPVLSNLSSAHTGYYYLTVQNGSCQLTAARYLNMGLPTASTPTRPALAATLAPNPSPGRTTLRVEALTDPTVQVTILNSTGQTVWQATVPTRQHSIDVPLDLSQHARGLYMVLLQTRTGTVYRKWVVE